MPMYGRSETFRVGSPTATPTDAAVDVYDEVPDPGDTVTVYVQLVDATGNGVALAGAVVGLTVGGDAVATLAASSVTTDANGRATTTLTVAADAADGSRCYVDVTGVTLP